MLVGATGFEPATSCPPGKRATKLRYAPLRLASGDSSSLIESGSVPLFRWRASEQTLGETLDGDSVFKCSYYRGGDR